MHVSLYLLPLASPSHPPYHTPLGGNTAPSWSPCAAALFTIARTWKQPKCPSTDEWIKKMWHIYTMEYYSAIKRNEIEWFVVRWMDLESEGPLLSAALAVGLAASLSASVLSPNSWHRNDCFNFLIEGLCLWKMFAKILLLLLLLFSHVSEYSDQRAPPTLA